MSDIAVCRILRYVGYCDMSDIAVCRILRYVGYCGMSDIAIYRILGYVGYCGMSDIAICRILRYVGYCGMSHIAVCRITEFRLGIILHFSFQFFLICGNEFSYLKIPRLSSLLMVTATRRRRCGWNNGKIILIRENRSVWRNSRPSTTLTKTLNTKVSVQCT